jgi:Fusaric acid resistance protein-like
VNTYLDRLDPNATRRVKGLRLVAAYGIAVLIGTTRGFTHGLSSGASLGALAGGFALWASVSEGRTQRTTSTRDLAILIMAAALGATMMITIAPIISGPHHPGPELTLVTGSFLVGYLRRFGPLGTGIGSQIYIGQLLAYTGSLTHVDLRMVAEAGLIAAAAAIIPRLVCHSFEHPKSASAAPEPALIAHTKALELRMGLQSAIAALVIVALNDAIGLEESAWAITACTYVITNSTSGTVDRVRRRILGTMVGVPLGLLFLPIARHLPLLGWIAAALAMILYSMSLPERYDIACGAFAFTLIVTLVIGGETSITILTARAWETLLGGVLGLATAIFIVPLRPQSPQTGT